MSLEGKIYRGHRGGLYYLATTTPSYSHTLIKIASKRGSIIEDITSSYTVTVNTSVLNAYYFKENGIKHLNPPTNPARLLRKIKRAYSNSKDPYDKTFLKVLIEELERHVVSLPKMR